MREWAALLARSPKARLVNLDLTPNTTAQMDPSMRAYNIGGFGDNVFSLLHDISTGNIDNDALVSAIERV